jgi:hypothetical protein
MQRLLESVFVDRDDDFAQSGPSRESFARLYRPLTAPRSCWPTWPSASPTTRTFGRIQRGTTRFE